MIGAVVLALAGDGLETTRLRIAAFIRDELAKTDQWSPGMKKIMLNAINALKPILTRNWWSYTATAMTGFSERGGCHKMPVISATLYCG